MQLVCRYEPARYVYLIIAHFEHGNAWIYILETLSNDFTTTPQKYVHISILFYTNVYVDPLPTYFAPSSRPRLLTRNILICKHCTNINIYELICRSKIANRIGNIQDLVRALQICGETG